METVKGVGREGIEGREKRKENRYKIRVDRGESERGKV